MYVYFSYQPNVEMNWNMKKYLPTAASCQSYFQVHLSFLKHSVVYTPSPIAKLKTHLLLWRFFPLKSHATFLWNFLTDWDVLSVKVITTFWGYNRPFSLYQNDILGSEAWRNKTKEMYYSLLSLKMISFVLFPQTSQPSMNFNILQLDYSLTFFNISTKACIVKWATSFAMYSCLQHFH